jgi:hypothetical protein
METQKHATSRLLPQQTCGLNYLSRFFRLRLQNYPVIPSELDILLLKKTGFTWTYLTTTRGQFTSFVVEIQA